MGSKRVMQSNDSLPDFLQEKNKNKHFGGTNENLPEEILFDIFSRLPAKSVGKFRCLSKSWHTQLSTTQFIKSHLSCKPQQKKFIFLTRCLQFVIMTLHNNITCSINSVMMVDSYTDLWGSCNGLVLLGTGAKVMFVFNPITLQQVYIPNSPLAPNKYEFVTVYGFGYDSNNDDYKIVRLSCKKGLDDEYVLLTFVDVYSLKRGVWNRVISSPNGHAHYHLPPGTFANNAIHWLIVNKESRSAIVAFDLANEVFYDVPCPTDVDVYNCSYDLVVLEGCLCVVMKYFNDPDFWIMKDYGSVESWTKFSFILSTFCEFKLLCFIGDEKEHVLVLIDGANLVVCNLKERAFKHMDTGKARFLDSVNFVESLVSPADLKVEVKIE
ncbi:hypothetical protein ACJIZ3_007411 [Penstemon smallii]|uniref:F-box domain-containing protein n=1 Tax=Penstemon smallii TaxID=265156 RepID=A0ABD3SAN2_9LAMI